MFPSRIRFRNWILDDLLWLQSPKYQITDVDIHIMCGLLSKGSTEVNIMLYYENDKSKQSQAKNCRWLEIRGLSHKKCYQIFKKRKLWPCPWISEKKQNQMSWASFFPFDKRQMISSKLDTVSIMFFQDSSALSLKLDLELFNSP